MFLSKNPIHINAEKENIAPLVLMPGDPLRAKYIAENFLDNPQEVCNLRNMLGFTGTYKGVKVSVIGSGMGMPSMSIYVTELFYYYNVQKVIRIGTCGVVSPDVKVPEIILASKSFSESNFAYTFDDFEGHITYPSSSLNNQIKKAAESLGLDLHIGDITTMDAFGPYIGGERVLDRMPKDLDVIGEEMEAYALFHVANHYEREAACLLTATDSKFTKTTLSSEERQTSLNTMIKLALEAIIL